MDRKSFQTAFGSVYEHSPWVADEVYESRLDTSPCNREQYADYLCGRFESVFTASGNERQLETLRAHPELACARSKQRKLTADSVSEQRGAGLDQCSESEFEEFARLNLAYRNKFDFPFIIAVKGLDRSAILDNFRKRIANDAETEFKTAVSQVCRIAQFRIEGILNAGE